jgi:glycosyltransferase involved in cell wall biosynthesis
MRDGLKLSIIICTYNRQNWVENLLVSISDQTIPPAEIIIVDASQEDIDNKTPPGLDININQH